MHSNYQNVFVIRPIEDHNFAFARRSQVSAPEKVASSLVFAWLLECEDGCPLWVHSREKVPNDAVFASRIERLQNYKKGFIIARVEEVLQLGHPLDVRLDLVHSPFVALVLPREGRIDLCQANLGTGVYCEVLPIVHY